MKLTIKPNPNSKDCMVSYRKHWNLPPSGVSPRFFSMKEMGTVIPKRPKNINFCCFHFEPFFEEFYFLFNCYGRSNKYLYIYMHICFLMFLLRSHEKPSTLDEWTILNWGLIFLRISPNFLQQIGNRNTDIDIVITNEIPIYKKRENISNT